jgi:hypothetical protein
MRTLTLCLIKRLQRAMASDRGKPAAFERSLVNWDARLSHPFLL